MSPFDPKFLRTRMKEVAAAAELQAQMEYNRQPSKYDQELAARVMNDSVLAGHLCGIVALYFSGNVRSANDTLARFLDEARTRIEGQIENEIEAAKERRIERDYDDRQAAEDAVGA